VGRNNIQEEEEEEEEEEGAAASEERKTMTSVKTRDGSSLVAALLTCIPEVCCLNLGWDTGYPDCSISWFSSVHPHLIYIYIWAEFLATNPEVPGSIPGAARYSEK
jgi:hypothetical protein